MGYSWRWLRSTSTSFLMAYQPVGVLIKGQEQEFGSGLMGLFHPISSQAALGLCDAPSPTLCVP